jgi:cell division protease FtsH
VVGTAVGCLIPGQQRPEVLSIVARSGGALGFTYIPPGEEDRKLMFADELRGRLVTLMGGLSPTVGPMSVPTLSAGGGEDSMFGGGGSAQNANKQVELEVKEALTSALWVAKETIEYNLAVGPRKAQHI